MFYVYVYYDPNTNEPFYVGKGTGHRSISHLCPSNLTGNSAKQNKIKKLLRNGTPPIIRFYIENVTEEEALNCEVRLIKQWGRADIGTGILLNHTDGGEGVSGVLITEARREYYKTITSARTRRRNLEDNPIHKPGVREKLSAMRKGRPGSMRGKKHTEEALEKIRANAKNRERRECEHCGKYVTPSNYSRVHGPNCAHNPNIDPVLLKERQDATRRKQELCNTEQLTCAHCGKTIRKSSYNRYHGDKCKMKSVTLVEFK